MAKSNRFKSDTKFHSIDYVCMFASIHSNNPNIPTTVATIECTRINSKIIQKTINLKTYKETYQNHIRLRLFIIDLVIFEEFQLKRHFAIDKLPIELPIQSIQIQDAKFHPNVSTILASNECIRIN